MGAKTYSHHCIYFLTTNDQLKLQFGPSNHWTPLKSTIWRKILECFP